MARMKADHPRNYGAEFGRHHGFGSATRSSARSGRRWSCCSARWRWCSSSPVATCANLLLARGESRQREIAIRTALGAGRRRLVRQLLTESVLLSMLGGAVGVLLAWWGVEVLPAINPSSLPRADAISIDLPVLGATLVLSLITGIVFGMVPAWQMLRDVHPELRENSRNVTTGRGGRRFRRVLVGVEVMIAVILVTGAGLVMRSFLKLSSMDPGFEPHGVLTMRLSLPDATYPTRTTDRGALHSTVRSASGAAGSGNSRGRRGTAARINSRRLGSHRRGLHPAGSHSRDAGGLAGGAARLLRSHGYSPQEGTVAHRREMDWVHHRSSW